MTVKGHTDDTDGTDFLWLAENAESADFYGYFFWFRMRSSPCFL